MTRIEEIEKLQKEWKATEEYFKTNRLYCFSNWAGNVATHLQAAALAITERPSNTQMQTEAYSCIMYESCKGKGQL